MRLLEGLGVKIRSGLPAYEYQKTIGAQRRLAPHAIQAISSAARASGFVQLHSAIEDRLAAES